jgi:hypothetical protein
METSTRETERNGDRLEGLPSTPVGNGICTADLDAVEKISQMHWRGSRGVSRCPPDAMTTLFWDRFDRWPTPGMFDIRVMSWNILCNDFYDDECFPFEHIPFDKRVVLFKMHLELAKPDLLFLQEVGKDWFEALRSFDRYTLIGSIYTRHQPMVLIHNDMFSRFNISIYSKPYAELISNDVDRGTFLSCNHHSRSVIMVDVMYHNRVIKFVNVHVPLRIKNLSMMNIIWKYLCKLVTPNCFLIGDLNTYPNAQHDYCHVYGKSRLRLNYPTNKCNRPDNKFIGEIDGIVCHKIYEPDVLKHISPYQNPPIVTGKQ